MTMAPRPDDAVAADAVVPLVFPFTRGGYRHVLLGRVGLWCVVERTWVGDGRPHLPHFEVVQLRRAPARTRRDGRVDAAREVYGECWSEPTLRHAGQRWERLRTEHAKGAELPPWSALGIMDDAEGFQAWKEGRLPRRETCAPTAPQPVTPAAGDQEG
jgi:hypothetical protein